MGASVMLASGFWELLKVMVVVRPELISRLFISTGRGKVIVPCGWPVGM